LLVGYKYVVRLRMLGICTAEIICIPAIPALDGLAHLTGRSVKSDHVGKGVIIAVSLVLDEPSPSPFQRFLIENNV